MLHAERSAEGGRLVDAAAPLDLLVDLLQGHDVGVEGRDRPCGAIEIEHVVGAPAVADVVGRHPDRGGGGVVRADRLDRRRGAPGGEEEAACEASRHREGASTGAVRAASGWESVRNGHAAP